MTSMTLDPPLTNPLPPGSELVAGVDTHKNTHHVAILDLVGRPVADREFRADGRGYAQIVAFLHAHGDVVRIGVESDRVTEERVVYLGLKHLPEAFHLGDQAEAKFLP